MLLVALDGHLLCGVACRAGTCHSSSPAYDRRGDSGFSSGSTGSDRGWPTYKQRHSVPEDVVLVDKVSKLLPAQQKTANTVAHPGCPASL